MSVRKPEGTEDLFGSRMRTWMALQDAAEHVFTTYCFEPIEPPLMEQLAVFVHGVGQTTDVVQKEMFRVLSAENFNRALAAGTEEGLKVSKRLALRPEGTAGIVRAVIENSLVVPGGAPAKLWYAGPMFRGERPAKGRLREFHQIGAEVIGADDPALDAELILMALEYFEVLGFRAGDIKLVINSIGHKECRAAYRELLVSYIDEHAHEFCTDCLERAKKNPLRVFDCKNVQCHAAIQGAPKITDALCEECARHFATVLGYLDAAGVEYEVDKGLVRGLDYYTRTVFEFHAIRADLGSQVAIGGGGRYDDLMEVEGAKPTPAAGFALGAERIMLALEAGGIKLGEVTEPLVYVVCASPALRADAFELCREVRSLGFRVEADYQARSMKSQMKQAGKLGAAYALILGDEEVAAGKVSVRNMDTHEQVLVNVDQLGEVLG